MVQFDNYSGPPFIEENPKIVPIVPVERKIDCNCCGCRRKQIPLLLGWASTIHKCQGKTIGKGEPYSYIIIFHLFLDMEIFHWSEWKVEVIY
jgi:hypothetical protein